LRCLIVASTSGVALSNGNGCRKFANTKVAAHRGKGGVGSAYRRANL
jgi:hypothetical protein